MLQNEGLVERLFSEYLEEKFGRIISKHLHHG